MAEENRNDAPRRLRARRAGTSGQGGLSERIRALITPTAAQLGYTIWDVAYVKEGADYILRVTIDKEGGITIDDCERMTHALDPVLDEADPIEQSYLLEVSSPGIEREITRDEHFAACAGEKVELRLFAPVDGCRVFTGILQGLDAEGMIALEIGGTIRTFARRDVSKIHTVFDF